jgi:hypothetical protein
VFPARSAGLRGTVAPVAPRKLPKRCEGDATPSSSVRDAPSGLETRPAGRPFGASGRRPAPLMMLQHRLATHSWPEDPKGRHDEPLSVRFGILSLCIPKPAQKQGKCSLCGHSPGPTSPCSAEIVLAACLPIRPTPLVRGRVKRKR